MIADPKGLGRAMSGLVRQMLCEDAMAEAVARIRKSGTPICQKDTVDLAERVLQEIKNKASDPHGLNTGLVLK